MAAIEVNVSLPLLQPSIRHRGYHARQTFARYILRSPLSLEGLNVYRRAKHQHGLRHILQVAMRH
jgi:hypothetical protein